MDESVETFVPLTFRRRGVQRVATDERSAHDVTLCRATFFNRWSGADGENSNQINSLQMGIEKLKL